MLQSLRYGQQSGGLDLRQICGPDKPALGIWRSAYSGGNAVTHAGVACVFYVVWHATGVYGGYCPVDDFLAALQGLQFVHFAARRSKALTATRG